MTYLAIDYGTKRIGLAISDPEHRFALPLKTLSDAKTWFSEISALIKEKNIERVVVGIPISLKGNASISTHAAHAFKAQLAECISVPIDTINEMLTTQMALQQQRMAGVSEKKGRAHVDALAACNILETYLQRRLKS